MQMNATITFTAITCCVEKCGITFMVPDTWEIKRRKDHTFFYCPNGHSQHFSVETEEERLRRELARATHRADQAQARAEHMGNVAAVADRRRAAMKGQVTKIKNRVSKGVCPCCKRTFQDLQRHMGTKHPDWAAEQNEQA